jgi:hypothetical protein
LGPHTAEEWIKMAHTEAPIACHQTIPRGEDGQWDDPKLRQCMGAAIYRLHAVKYMRNPSDAQRTAVADREHVFSDILGRDFIAYHRREGGSSYQAALETLASDRKVGDGLDEPRPGREAS